MCNEMRNTSCLDNLIKSGEFRLDKLIIKDIDNSSVLQLNKPAMEAEEITLFHKSILSGDGYFDILHDFVYDCLSHGNAAPVVRFADGEYAFYEKSLHCNGLYQQAESVEAIEASMANHLKALNILNQTGKLAPLIFPGNIQRKRKTFFSSIRKTKSNDTGRKFLDFLFDNSIKLTKNNYLPFYTVYAYLTSRRFCQMLDAKNICIISSECNISYCRKWFERYSSRPNIIFTKIPDSYVATQWASIKKEVLERMPSNTELCLIGAGIGSLLVCVDVAHEFSIPAIDAGHVLNMMNGRLDKSNGPRLYTIRGKSSA